MLSRQQRGESFFLFEDPARLYSVSGALSLRGDRVIAGVRDRRRRSPGEARAECSLMFDRGQRLARVGRASASLSVAASRSRPLARQARSAYPAAPRGDAAMLVAPSIRYDEIATTISMPGGDRPDSSRPALSFDCCGPPSLFDLEQCGLNSVRFLARTVNARPRPWQRHVGRHGNEHQGTQANLNRRRGKLPKASLNFVRIGSRTNGSGNPLPLRYRVTVCPNLSAWPTSTLSASPTPS
jgi:hypothetical protein